MRVAFCLVGIVGSSNFGMGLGKPIDFRLGHHFHKKHIFDNNDVDVFIHSWSTEFEKELVDLYKPKKHLFEEQIDFGQDNIRDQCILSRWYSTAMSVRLKSLYEEENNFKYDWVILYRFDHVFLTDLNFSNFDNSNFYVRHSNPHGWVDGVRDEKIKEGIKTVEDYYDTKCDCHEKQWMGKFNENRLRLYDAWCFSSSENIDKFSNFYETFSENNLKLHSPHDEFYSQLKRIGLEDKLKFEFFGETETEALRSLFKDPSYRDGEEFDVNKFERFDEKYVRQNDEVKSRFKVFIDGKFAPKDIDKTKSGFNPDLPIIDKNII